MCVPAPPGGKDLTGEVEKTGIYRSSGVEVETSFPISLNVC